MSEKGIKGMLELIVPRLLRMIMEKQLLTEKEALTQLYASDPVSYTHLPTGVQRISGD